jgi:hypothetical protein
MNIKCRSCVHLDGNTCTEFGVVVIDPARDGAVNCSEYEEV